MPTQTHLSGWGCTRYEGTAVPARTPTPPPSLSGDVFLMVARAPFLSHHSAVTKEHGTKEAAMRGVAIVTCSVSLGKKAQTVLAVDTMKPVPRAGAGDREAREHDVVVKAAQQCGQVVAALGGRKVVVGVDSRYAMGWKGNGSLWLTLCLAVCTPGR